MKNIASMLKQAQQMQAKMAEMQAQLDQVEMTGASGGGLVEVTLTGKGLMRKIKIDKSLLDPNEGEVLEDLILAAFNEAKQRVEAHVAEEMGKLTGGLQLPGGMKLPF
jgi:nucleoid-associated protein EbfC